MKTRSNNFYLLCNSIRDRAIRDITQGLPDARLTKWQELVTAILETELAMHQVRSSLKLLKNIPDKEALNAFSMSEGAWIDYHVGTWSFRMCSLLDKAIELVHRVGQTLIKPHNPRHKDIVRPLIESLVSQKDKVGKIRHPLAHKGEGGIIERVIETDLWKNIVILPSPVDFNEVLNSSVPYQARSHSSLHNTSTRVIAQILGICGELHHHIDWSRI